MLLELSDINKRFDSDPVVRSVSLDVAAGEIVVLLGPSGCGKTTLLRIIAGLERADNGKLSLDGRSLAQIPVHERGFGFVFQDYALFPHMNVFQNVAFGLRMLKWDQRALVERVEQVLDLVGLAGLSSRAIHELSGGEQQRVALARSIAPSPRLLLLDEPLGALDRALRERLMIELRSILKQAGGITGRPEGITAIYVTHDQAEAFAVADRIVVMNEGGIEQVGTPTELYHRPATVFVARFLGMENLIEGEAVSTDPCIVRTVIGDLRVATPMTDRQLTAGRVKLLIRPEAGRLAEESASTVSGRIEGISFRGRYQIAKISIPSQPSPVSLKLEFDSVVSLPEPGSNIHLSFDSSAILLLESG